MNELLWAVIALGVLGFLMMLGFGKSQNNLMPGAFTSFEDVIEGGLVMIVVMIVLLPLYPFYLLIVAIWRYYHPIKLLPVHGDDPVWGRTVNEKLARDTFLAVQQAWTARNPAPVQDLLFPGLYADLQAECDRLTAQHEVNSRQDITLTEVYVHDENAAKHSFQVKIAGAMTNVTRREADGQITAGLPDPHPFEENLEFDQGPGADGRWLLGSIASLPHPKPVKKTRSGSPKTGPPHPRKSPPAA